MSRGRPVVGLLVVGIDHGDASIRASGARGKAPARSRLAFGDLAGWAEDDHAAAFAAFQKSCGEHGRSRSAAAGATPTATCRGLPRGVADEHRRAERGRATFFEAHFQPMRVVPVHGRRLSDRLLRARIPGSRSPAPVYRVPLLDRPDDLVTVPPGRDPAGPRSGPPGGAAQPRRLRALSGPRRHRGRRPGSAGETDRVSARTRRGLHRPRPGLGAHPPRGRIGDAGRLCGPQRPSLHVDRQAAGASRASWTSRP